MVGAAELQGPGDISATYRAPGGDRTMQSGVQRKGMCLLRSAFCAGSSYVNIWRFYPFPALWGTDGHSFPAGNENQHSRRWLGRYRSL